MAGKDLRELHPSAIKVDITVTLQLLKSLSLVSGNTRRVHVLLGSAGRIAPTPAFGLFLLLEVLPTCVIVWPLSACLLQSAVLQQPSPPPSISHARSLPPCGPLQTSFPPLPSPFPPKSSSFRTGPPPCIESTTHYYYCYTRVCQQPPLPLSPPVSLLQGSLYPETESTDVLFYCIFPFFFFSFFFFLLELLVCILILFCCEKFADIVAVIMNDCYIWWFHGLYAVFIFFPVPPTAAASKAEPACSLEVRLSRVNHWGREGGGSELRSQIRMKRRGV